MHAKGIGVGARLSFSSGIIRMYNKKSTVSKQHMIPVFKLTCNIQDTMSIDTYQGIFYDFQYNNICIGCKYVAMQRKNSGGLKANRLIVSAKFDGGRGSEDNFRASMHRQM